MKNGKTNQQKIRDYLKTNKIKKIITDEKEALQTNAHGGIIQRFGGNYTFEEQIKLDHNFKLSFIHINFV